MALLDDCEPRHTISNQTIFFPKIKDIF